jgi:hypothetical protein
MSQHTTCKTCGEWVSKYDDHRCAAPAAGTGQHPVIGMLIEVARCAFLALDHSEEREGPDGREHVLDAQSFDDLSDALDALDGLPDDQPGVTMGPAQKAEWALRTVAATGAQGLTAAARDVLAERQRQIHVEGWTPEHDDEHTHASMAQAAACYALHAAGYSSETVLADWPWDPQWWKPSDDPRRNLEKAGALTLAEIERLDRAALAASKEGA